MKDDSLEDAADLAASDVLAREIAEEFEAAAIIAALGGEEI